MKRIISILLSVLVLLNALGLCGLLMGLQYKAGLDMMARLDKQLYNDDETVTLKVPLSLPYHTDNGSYERVNGEIEYGGEFYRLVKQKFEGDTLYIVCIKDVNSKAIKGALSDYVKTFTDKPVDSKQNSKFMSGFIKDFLPTYVQISHASSGWNYAVENHSVVESFSSICLGVLSPPPRG